MLIRYVKFAILCGWICSTTVQAAGLIYAGVGPQGQPVNSQIEITAQQGDLFSLQIHGGMPELNPLTGQAYVRALQYAKADEYTQVYGIFAAPLLYVVAPAQVTSQKLVVNVTRIYVFEWQTAEQFKLLQFFQEAVFCKSQVCSDGLFCGASECGPKSETMTFDNPVTYFYQK